jgi:CDP-glycerol glycerophosphotransferase
MTNSNQNTALTSIIPIGNIENGLANLSMTLNGCKNLPIQIIIVDDLATRSKSDELVKLLQDFQDLNITYTNGKFGSPGLARNKGLTLAHAKWITFWDSDDVAIASEYLAMAESTKACRADIGIGDFSITSDFDGSLIETIKIENESSFLAGKIANRPGLWRLIFRREIIKNLNFASISMGEDQLYILDAFTKTKKFYFHHKEVYKYYVGAEFHLSTQSYAQLDFPILMEELVKRSCDGDLLALSVLSRQMISAVKSRLSNVKLLPKITFQLAHSKSGIRYLTFFYRHLLSFVIVRS